MRDLEGGSEEGEYLVEQVLRSEENQMSDTATVKNHAAFIWSVADLLRGDYKQSEYGKVILPFTVLRRLDCVLESTKAAVLARLMCGVLCSGYFFSSYLRLFHRRQRPI